MSKERTTFIELDLGDLGHQEAVINYEFSKEENWLEIYAITWRGIDVTKLVTKSSMKAIKESL